MVLLHGFCETHQIWDGFAQELANNFLVLSYDLPGFGESSLPTDEFTIEQVATHVLADLEKRKISNSILVGHSLGGYVALAMAAARPRSFLGIVLFHSTAFADSEEKKINRNKTIEFVQRHGVAPFVETFVPSLFHNKAHPGIVKVHQLAMKTSKDTLIAYSKAMRDRPSRATLLANGVNRFLILAGQHDSVIPISISEDLAKLSDKTVLTTLENTGHMGMIENTVGALKAIKEFASQF